MRFALAVAVCGGLMLAGCGGGSSSGGGSTTPPILPPTANAGGPYTGTVGTAVTFNGAASKDPQSQGLTYSWSFGDGSTCSNPCTAGATPTHTYSQSTQNAGQSTTAYSVTLTVQNTSGFTGQATTTATITGTTPLADAALTGSVATGTTAIVGAHVYLLAANTTGYGAASVSLLSATETGNTADSVGSYVVTDGQGNFTMSGDYTCTASQQLYIYSLGGSAGSQPIASAGLMAAIGSCPATGTTVSAKVNEVSTVAAAYALAGYAVDALHVSSSGTTQLEQTGLANAFLNAANLVKLSTGVALTTTPAGNGAVPQTQINALANILSVCVNPGTVGLPYSAANCASLLGDALAGGTTGKAPTDTASVAINIAHNPGSGLNSDIYNLANASPYTPTLSRQPNDYTIAIAYSGGGLNGPQGIAIDGAGNAWIANMTGNSVTKLSSVGAGATGSPYTGGAIGGPAAIAIDGSGNAWIANNTSGSVTELSATGTASSYTACNLSGPKAIAIDGSNNVWIPDYGHNDVCELSNAGALAPGSPFTLGGFNSPDAIAIDGSGNAWVANFSGGGSVTRLSNTGAVVAGSPYTTAGLVDPNGVAIDASGNAWISNLAPSGVPEISKAGALVTWTNASLSSPVSVAVDGLGNVWVANQVGNTVTEFANGGGVVSGSAGYGGAIGAASGIAIDGSGDVWVGNSTGNSVTEYIGAAAPAVTPLAVAVKNNTLGARP